MPLRKLTSSPRAGLASTDFESGSRHTTVTHLSKPDRAATSCTILALAPHVRSWKQPAASFGQHVELPTESLLRLPPSCVRRLRRIGRLVAQPGRTRSPVDMILALVHRNAANRRPIDASNRAKTVSCRSSRQQPLLPASNRQISQVVAALFGAIRPLGALRGTQANARTVAVAVLATSTPSANLRTRPGIEHRGPKRPPASPADHHARAYAYSAVVGRDSAFVNSFSPGAEGRFVCHMETDPRARAWRFEQTPTRSHSSQLREIKRQVSSRSAI